MGLEDGGDETRSQSLTVPMTDFSAAEPVRAAGNAYLTFGKRATDIAVVVLTAPIVLPLLALILLLTWAEGGKPLYVQRRIGRGGREFRCWKVRTMVQNADQVLADLIARDSAVAQEWAENQKLVNDPRITRFGRFLRRSSLDELPQLWNVLNGTMSLIGPRPFTPDQTALYGGGRETAYYRLRPGISGLWQVSRRNAGTFSERIAYDEEYGRQPSLTGDLAIIWRTFAVVLKATGI